MQGLQNLGATCAVNSLVQIICRNQYMREIVLKSQCGDNTLCGELREILDLMHNKNHSLCPKKFITHLYKTFENFFTIGEQLDIGELWMFLHDKLCQEQGQHKEMAKCNVSLDNINIDDNKGLSESLHLNQYCASILHKSNNSLVSEWQAITQGILLYMIKCSSCGNVLYNFEPFIAIPLDICESLDVVSMFREFLKPFTCQGDWKCEKCNEFTKYEKSHKLWKLPKVLIFIVKRFADQRSKNNSPININSEIIIKKGSIIQSFHHDSRYIFSSMALHFGNMHGGHYCAVGKHEDKYIIYDDNRVATIDNILEKNKNAYMLVYSNC